MSTSLLPPSQWQPLYLSCIAGASTCIGAAVVFCQPTYNGKRVVPPGMMAFSLALAGSVMVTVSIISIIPECLQDDSKDDGRFHMIPFFSIMMFWRVFFFFAHGPVTEAVTKTDERICLADADELPDTIIPNLQGLIPLCFESDIQKPVNLVDITTPSE